MTTGDYSPAEAVTVEDLRSSDQIEVRCPCGHKVGPAFGLWSAHVRRTPLRLLQPRFTCRRCGHRGAAVVISAFVGRSSRLEEVWQFASSLLISLQSRGLTPICSMRLGVRTENSRISGASLTAAYHLETSAVPRWH